MSRVLRIACCAALIAALTPAGALAAPRAGAAVDAHRAAIAMKKGASAKLASSSLAVVADDIYEPDEDNPQVIDGLLPLSQEHTISQLGDDWDTYSIHCTPGDMYTFETTGGLDTFITLYDSDYHIIATFDDQSDTNLNARATWTASASLTDVVVEVSSYFGLEGAYTMLASATPRTIRTTGLERIWGPNRVAGAVAAAKSIYGTRWKKTTDGGQVTDIIVVCGEDKAIVDSLSAASLAGWYQAPLLMTYSAKLPNETVNAITAIRNANGGKVKIHVLGGTAVVTAPVYAALSARMGKGGSIERISGLNRYDLAAKVATRLDTLYFAKYGVHCWEVYVANGQNPAAFYDALAASGFCYSWNAPLILTGNTTVPSPTKTLISGRFVDAYVYAISSTKFIPTSVFNALDVGSAGAERIATAPDRFTAATQISQWGIDTNAASQSHITVANTLADALAAGTFVGANGGVLLWAPVTGPSGVTSTFLVNHRSSVDTASVFGGTAVFSAGGYNKVRTDLNGVIH